MSTNVPIGLLFRCPGLHGSGCPDRAYMAFAIGLKAKDGISFNMLDKTVKRQGWMLAALRLEQPDGSTVATVEPVCGDCGKRVTQDIVDSAGGKVDVSALGFVRRILGSETPS